MFNILSHQWKCKSMPLWDFILPESKWSRSIKQMTAQQMSMQGKGNTCSFLKEVETYTRIWRAFKHSFCTSLYTHWQPETELIRNILELLESSTCLCHLNFRIKTVPWWLDPIFYENEKCNATIILILRERFCISTF